MHSHLITFLSKIFVVPIPEGCVTLCPHISISNLHTILLVTQRRTIARLCLRNRLPTFPSHVCLEFSSPAKMARMAGGAPPPPLWNDAARWMVNLNSMVDEGLAFLLY